jgi:hypothetical protein
VHKRFEGMVLSIHSILLYRVEHRHRRIACWRACAANAWWIAAALRSMAVCANGGRCAASVKPCGPLAASLAAMSAALLPAMLQWPGVHQMVSLGPLWCAV